MTEENTSPATIMVVDDNPMNLVLLDRILSSNGYAVIKSKGTKVIQTCEKNPPDMILLDIAMPEMDGHEVCECLKRQEVLKEIPIIFISTLDTTDDKVKALSAGGVDYITKPFQDDEVLARIEIHLKLRNLQKQLTHQNTILQDEISRRLEAERELIVRATTDPLTNISNRRHFFETATKELSRTKRAKQPFSVIMIDIDYFKKLNDTYGHFVGDQVLICFAEICQDNLRDYDLLARYGGEEFVILLPNTDRQQAHIIAERLRSKVAETNMKIDNNSITITISLGVCCTNGDIPIQLTKVVARADRSLYQSKQDGRNRVSLCE